MKTFAINLIISLIALAGSAAAQSIDFNRAVEIATGQYPSASVVEVDFEREYGRSLWDVKLSNGMAVYIDAASGNIVELEPWRANSVTTPAPFTPVITPPLAPTPTTGMADATTLAAEFGIDIEAPTFWEASLAVATERIVQFEALVEAS